MTRRVSVERYLGGSGGGWRLCWPTRLVLDAGVVLYHGDSATVLDTDWLATVGVGLEVDTGLPAVQAGRLMLNGVVAEGFSGFSIGFGLRF